MTLAEVLAQDVSDRTRIRGNRYFLGGAVRAIEGSEAHVTATVRGSEWYHVNLRRERDAIVASCECPHFSDQREACKHLWAVILAADASGFLLGADPVTEDLYLELDNPNRQPAAFDNDGAAGAFPTAAAHEPWRRFLTAVRDHVVRDSTTPARHPQGEILYVIDSQSTVANGALTLQVTRRVRKKNGEWGKPQPAVMTLEALEHLPDPADRHILALLLGASEPSDFAAAYTSVYSRATFRLQGPLIETVLSLLGQTDRLYLRGLERLPKGKSSRLPELTPLSWDSGLPWRFRLDVTLSESGAIQVDGSLLRGETRMAVTEPEMVLADGFLIAPLATNSPRAPSGRVDPGHEESLLARLDHAGAFGWLAELRRSGPVVLPHDAAPSLIETMARSNIDPALLPEALRYAVIAAPPHPRIRISRPAGSSAPGRREQLEATVQFEYGGTALAANGEATTYDVDHRRLIRRDSTAEQAAVQRLHQFGFHKPWYFETRGGTFAIPVEKFPNAVRALVEGGWHVEAEGRVFRAAQALDMQVKSGIDWFELHGRIDFGEGRLVPVADLLAALRRGEATVLLDDGTRGLVPEEWLRRYARVASFGEAAGDHVRYRPSQTALLDALLESQPSVRVDEAYNRARAELAQFEGVRPLDAPATFRGRLRDYQREALGWFAFLRQFRFGGCLADDMGLGKTVMVLALLESRRRLEDRRPSLAVVPRSLVFNWVDEAARFAPELRVLDYTGSSRDAAQLGDYDLVLTTYGTLRREAARLMEYEFDYVILDEAQAIKNPATASSKSARLLRGQHRLALSGTPIENHLGELWSLFDFLNPGFLGPAGALGRAMAPASGSPAVAAAAVETQPPAERGQTARSDRLDFALIARALRPFILRRTKEQVAPELPPKVEQTIHCELEPSERRFYDELRAHYREKLLAAVARQGMNRSKIQVLEALLRLRQAASHVGLVDAKRGGERSAKFDMLLSRLRELADEGHKALVFSQFTTLLGLLRPQLEQEGLAYEYLDGRTRDRAERVERFERTPECPVFLISLKAGGLGLNLTAADYVFLLDPWWNPAVEAQAIDRAYRIGQTKHVFAYRLIARDTVEEKIADLQRSKRQLADALFAEDAGLMKVLQPEDLEWLLS